jgi:uncharacterized membrane protein
MSWNHRYRLASYLRSSLWIVPILAMVLWQLASYAIQRLDAHLGWTLANVGVDGARAVCNTVITFTLSFVVFTFGSLLVAIQVASGQYTPRIIATTLLRDNVIRYTVGFFVFALLFAVKALNHSDAHVQQLVILITALLGVVCLILFLFLIDYAARLLRPVSLVGKVGESGLAVLNAVYPELFKSCPDKPHGSLASSAPQRTVPHVGKSAIVVAVNVPELIASAFRSEGIIEFAPQVGDFVGSGEPLFHLRDGARSLDDDLLRSWVIFGSERTMEQDPLFALRILVDIAIKALSAAINDPTTAVLAMDQIQRLLSRAGCRTLRTDYISDSGGKLRLVFRTPNWDDFVNLAFCEIRFCGAGNVQIARRLRAILLTLISSLPPDRHPALQRELARLDCMLEKHYELPEDLALARIPDSQGLGGSTDPNSARDAA